MKGVYKASRWSSSTAGWYARVTGLLRERAPAGTVAASDEERAAAMPGDRYLAGGPGARLVMTRGIDIEATPAAVWGWLAQLGRGAGWYSIDELDNGRRESANHIVSWIPAPGVGDASAIVKTRERSPR